MLRGMLQRARSWLRQTYGLGQAVPSAANGGLEQKGAGVEINAKSAKSSPQPTLESVFGIKALGDFPPLTIDEAMNILRKGQAKLYDVRSPGEFTEDSIPGSENVPVLDDQERKTVGTLHKAASKVEARQIGAALIAKRIASHLDTRFTPTPASQSELKIIYCARGGLRSQSMAAILNLIGYRARIIEGGYRSYRNHVQSRLSELPPQFNFNVVCGLTGTRKTRTLQKLAKEYGQQVLDLEAFANHRGSVLGGFADGQPTQRMFETRIVQALDAFDPSKPVWIESESTKVGNLYVPRLLWERAILSPAKVYELVSSVEDRVEFLLADYQDWHWSTDQLHEALTSLTKIAGDKSVKHWRALVDRGDLSGLVRSLLIEHYDVRYKQSKVSKALQGKSIQTTDLFRDVFGGRS